MRINFVALIVLFSLSQAAQSVAAAKGKGPAGGDQTGSAPNTPRQFHLDSALADGTPVSIMIVASSADERKANSTMSEAISGMKGLYTRVVGDGGVEARLNSVKQGTPVETDGDVFALLARAKELTKLTGGWFGITAQSKNRHGLSLNPATHTVTVSGSDLSVDLKDITLGFLADVAIDTIRGAGFPDARVDVASIGRTIGHDIYTPWNVKIGFGGEGLNLAHRALSYNLSNTAFAAVTPDGMGRTRDQDPKNALRSVTVFAGDASSAVAYAIATFAQGAKAGFRFIEMHPEIRGVIVDANGVISTSTGLGTGDIK